MASYVENVIDASPDRRDWLEFGYWPEALAAPDEPASIDTFVKWLSQHDHAAYARVTNHFAEFLAVRELLIGRVEPPTDA